MYRPILLTLLSIAFVCLALAQQAPLLHCGQKEITDHLLRENPVLKQYQEGVERQIQQYQLARRPGAAKVQRTTAVVTLPVVVHIIHNNGAENIPDAQVLAGIQHLNQAFANTGYYDPADGVNTQIQFCLAQRDPNNNATNGITRNVSPYTVMGGANYYTDDQQVKNINRWNPSCYINIWLVRSIPGSVAGYAYLPTAHGSNLDGILMEAAWFGSSAVNSVVTIHEMGHYLGLYHTFEGACKNDDCTSDGDHVCDTPPDQSTGAVGCNTSVNSCSTDALSGFGADVSDLKEDYMDYGNFDCMKVFTQGQSDRMNWFIQNVRGSLLRCKSCLIPCPAPVTAGFTASATAVTAGTPVTFTNSSVNAGSYSWYLNNVIQSTTFNYSSTFNVAGTYIIKLVAHSNNPLCDSAVKTEVVTVTCPVALQFSPGDTSITVNNTINFTNATTGATTYDWLVNGISQSTTLHFSQAFTTTGNYAIKLKASNGFCSDSLVHHVVVRDACLQETFQNAYGSSRNDVAYDVRVTTDGGSIVAGKSASFNSGNDDGYLIKLDKNGRVQWSRTYGSIAADVFYRVIPTSDGGYIAVGQTYSYGLLTGAAWVVKVDATGTVQWSRQFGENSTNGETASNVLQTSDGGYMITGRQNNAPTVGNVLVIKLNAAGTLIWSKVYDDSDSDNGSALFEDNGGVLVAGTSRSTTWHDVFLMKLDPANGNVIWSKKYDIDGRNNSGGATIYRQGNYYLLPVTTIDNFTNTNTGRAMVLRVDLNGDAVDVKEIIAPDYVLGSAGTFAPTADGGFVTQHNENNGAPDFNLIKVSAAGAVEWALKYPRADNQTNLALRVTADGGFISAGTHVATTTAQDVYVVKTDALGNTPGCASTRVQVSINNPPFTTTSFSWFGIRNTSFSGTSMIMTQAGAGNTQTIVLCSGGPCTTPPVDACLPTFQKTYFAPGNYNAFYIHTTADGGSVMAGVVNPTAGDGDLQSSSMDALAMKLDASGDIQWAKRIGGNQYDELRKIKPTRDGGYIAIGSTRSFGTFYNSISIYLVKLTATGNIAWTKTYSADTTNRDVGRDVIETSDGGFAFTGTNEAAVPYMHGIFAKTDANGNIIWSRQLYREEGTEMHSVVEDADTLVLGANYWVSAEMQYYGSIIKVNKYTGNIISSISFLSDNRSNYATQLYKTPAGFMAGLHLIDGNNFNGKQQGILELSQDLNALSNQKLARHDLNPWSSITPTSDGGFIASAGRYAFGNNFYLFKVNRIGTFDWEKAYGNFPGIIMQISANAQQYPNGTYISACTYHDPITGTDGKLHVVKTAPNGNTPGCRVDDGANNLLIAVVISIQPITWNKVSDFNYKTSTDVISNIVDLPLTVTQQCAPVTCALAGIQGNDSICLRADTVTYLLKRSGDCVLPATWTIDPAYAQITATTDSTISILFKKTGAVTLYATIAAYCEVLKDSIPITIFDTVPSLDLGPDLQLCTISTWSLNAGKGFKSYQWQDGSTDSTLTVFTPGIYHVLALDHCGNPYRDTVTITQAPPVPFDLGIDLERCINDTLVLTAPAGFTNYRWSADYKINSAYGQTIRIFTDKDTIYSVTAEKGPGCLVIDTIRVTVKQIAPLYLGNDTSFCKGEIIILDAGPGFSDYAWNTGAVTQQITAGTAGSFWIAATNSNGCTSRDTLVVNKVFSLPPVSLGKDTVVCTNEVITFNAGNGFTAYQWQDGSAGNSFATSQPGTYWVQVTDNHTCTNADTVSITGIKDCRVFLYLPNAFSPNNDRQNDVFRPVVSGLPAKFRLTVYNRWGQKIFETTDVHKGWDGTFKGQPQPAGSFVWTCQYQFIGSGQTTKVEKGVLILIR